MKLRFGFHTSVNGVGVNRSFYETLDQNGIPFFAKVTDALPADAQQIAQQSIVPHVVVVRISIPPAGSVPPPSGNPDTPDYSKPPAVAAAEHWAWHKPLLEQMGVDPNITWIETINEPDKTKAEWLAEFAIETAHLTMRDGYKWLAFGWSTGEPEAHHWQGQKMREFLALVAQNPTKLGIALHEYSLSTHNIKNGDGYLIGRFQFLLDVNPNVNIYVTEWGWEPFDAPLATQAMTDILTIGELYNIPQIKGAAIWALNKGWGNIHLTVQSYIDPLLNLTLTTELPNPPEPPGPTPVLNYKSIPILLPQDATLTERTQVLAQEFLNRRTITQSLDEGVALVQLAKPESYLIVYDISRWSQPEQKRILGVKHELRSLTPPSNDVKLNLPIVFGQRDSRWANKCIGICNGHSKTIGNWGCLLVAYNMMAQYMGLTQLAPDGFNDFAVQQGVFQGPYILPAALKNMYPNQIKYDGYMTQGAALNAKIKTWIDNKIPVPARVDFNPATGQWEQHWVLVIGYTDSDFIVADPWHGDEVLLSRRYNIAGDDLLEGIFYTKENLQLIDLVSYIVADPLAWRVVQHPEGNQENFRDYRFVGSNAVAMVKNGDAPQYAQEAEFWQWDDSYIYLTQDTSPGPDSMGTPRLYKVTPGIYAKRYMAIGETFRDGGHTVQFYAKADCRKLLENSGASQNVTTILDLRTNYTFNRYGQNLTLDSVLFVQGNTETQIFAKHEGRSLGRVGWTSPWDQSEIVALHFDRGYLLAPPRKYC